MNERHADTNQLLVAARREAFAGAHEVFLREIREDGRASVDGELPICRFVRWYDEGKEGWELSPDQSGTLLSITLAEKNKTTRAVEIVDLIDKLRAEEGNQVVIISDNADFNSHANSLIICVGAWTDWQERAYDGEGILECLRNAVGQMTECESETTGEGISSELRPVLVECLKCCARCGQDHQAGYFYPLLRSDGTWTHWAPCPTNGQPILMKITEKSDTP